MCWNICEDALDDVRFLEAILADDNNVISGLSSELADRVLSSITRLDKFIFENSAALLEEAGSSHADSSPLDWRIAELMKGLQNISDLRSGINAKLLFPMQEYVWDEDYDDMRESFINEYESCMQAIGKMMYDYSCLTSNTPKITARDGRGRTRSDKFSTFFIVDKQYHSALIKKIHEMCVGKRGKAFAMVIRGCHEAKVLVIPPVKCMYEEFGDEIGSMSALYKYLSLSHYYKSFDADTIASYARAIKDYIRVQKDSGGELL